METNSGLEAAGGKRPAVLVERPGRVIAWLLPAFALLLLVAGLIVSSWRAETADREMRADLLATCQAVAASIHPDEVAALQFTAEDAQRPAFQRIRRQLAAYGHAAGIRSIYTMGRRGDTIYFGPESLAEDDPWASAPGTPFEEPQPADLEIFQTGTAFTTGPQTDEYGTFVSASAPVFEPRTGKVILVVGMDVDARRWARLVAGYRVAPLVLTAGLILVLLAGHVLVLWRRRRSPETGGWLLYADVLTTAAFGLSLTVALSFLGWDAESRTRRAEFRNLATAPSLRLAEAMQDARDFQLISLAGLFEASQEVTRNEFRVYAEPMARHAAVQACEWIPVVRHEDRQRLEQSEREAHGVPFTITDYDRARGLVPAKARDVYYPVFYAVPETGNELALGFDIGSDPIRRTTVEEAIASRLPTATEAITLVQETNREHGVVLLHPVFRSAGTSDSSGDFMGFAAAVLRVNSWLQETLAPPAGGSPVTAVDLFEVAASQPPVLIGSFPAGLDALREEEPDLAAGSQGAQRIVLPLLAFGRSYAIVIRPMPGTLVTRPIRLGWVAASSGLFCTAALTAFVAALARRRAVLQKQVQARTAELSASEEKYRALFTTMQEGFALHEIICDDRGQATDYRFLDVNPAFERLTGLRRHDLIGRTVREVLPALESSWITLYGEVALSGRPRSFENFSRELGKHYQVSAYSPGPGRFAVVFSDVSERKRAEEALRRLTRAVEQSPASIVIADAGGRIEYVNPKFTGVSGYTLEDVRGRTLGMLMDEATRADTYETLWTTISSGGEWHGELLSRTKSDKCFWEYVSVSPIRDADANITHFVAVKEDITQRKQAEAERLRLEQQLLQAQRMETVGQLAGGVAHDFNNLLQAILGFTELLLAENEENSPGRPELLEIRQAAERARELTRQLLAFSRKQMLQPREINLNDIIDNSHRMLRRLLGEDVALETRLKDDLALVRADPSQIDQVIVNLAVNARDAMPRGGRLSFSTETVRFGPEDIFFHPDARAGEFVCLSVSDNGEGMTEEIQSHLFEPFFTTKGPGRGTGLGLATIYGIIRQHDGWIHVYSQLGEGSTFKVYLPAVTGTAVSLVAPALEQTIPHGRGERILVVEDEEGVRNLAVRVLSRHGFDVRSAPSGKDALTLLKRAEPPLDLVVCDVVLPDMNGLELTGRLTDMQPDLGVILTSGYTDEKSRWPEIAARGVLFIQKPFPTAELLRTVQRALRERRIAREA